MDTIVTSPLQILLAEVDSTLRDHGEDPDIISQDDKLLYAAQCVEVSHRQVAASRVFRL